MIVGWISLFECLNVWLERSWALGRFSTLFEVLYMRVLTILFRPVKRKATSVTRFGDIEKVAIFWVKLAH